MIRPLVFLFVMVSCVSAAPPARYGRIDVYSVDGAFDVRDVRVRPGAQILDVGWRRAGMADTGATAQARAREAWREIWIEVVPERDGKLQINFQGEYYRKQSEDDVRLVWVDQIQAVLLEHGHRGTFFLNDPKRNVYGKDYGLLIERSVSELGRMLTSGGTTIGGHSLTHPMMSYQNRNRMVGLRVRSGPLRQPSPVVVLQSERVRRLSGPVPGCRPRQGRSRPLDAPIPFPSAQPPGPERSDSSDLRDYRR